jgi:hypothetical protein
VAEGRVIAEVGFDLHLGLELLRTAAALAVPVILAVAAHALQRRQKFFEAVMAEKVKHYGTISPLLNQIFAYRYRVGDFLDRTPESVLEAKRKADHEFWTYEYLWSEEFRRAYHDFMQDGFSVFGAEGTRGRIRADGRYYPLKPTTPGWDAFSGEDVDRKALAALYTALKRAIAHDLGFRRA